MTSKWLTGAGRFYSHDSHVHLHAVPPPPRGLIVPPPLRGLIKSVARHAG